MYCLDSMSDSMFPKDLLPIIGGYIQPKIFKVQYSTYKELYMYADSLDHVYEKMCNDDFSAVLTNILRYICTGYDVCILSGNKPPPEKNVVFVWLSNKWFKYQPTNGYGLNQAFKETMWSRTLQNIQQTKLLPDDIRSLFEYTANNIADCKGATQINPY